MHAEHRLSMPSGFESVSKVCIRADADAVRAFITTIDDIATMRGMARLFSLRVRTLTRVRLERAVVRLLFLRRVTVVGSLMSASILAVK